MKKSTKLAIRASELRSRINALEPGEASVEKRREYLAELETVETEYRDALTAEAADGSEHRGGDGLTAEEREYRSLDERAELRNVVRAVLAGEEITGPEGELQRHRGLSANEVPWELVAPRAEREDRADAATASPATANVNQRTPLGRVFARSATAALGVPMPSVPTGDVNVPVLTAGGTASILAKDANIGDAGAGTIDAITLSPKRIQAEYILRREDRARLLGLDDLLRMDLSKQISDLVDVQVLAGAGTGANIGGFLATPANGGLPAVMDPGGEVNYATSLESLYAGVDGAYAGSVGECAMVVGDETYRKLGTLTNTGSGEIAGMTFSRMLARFMASANIPDIANHIQDGIIAKLGAGQNSVCPVWGGLTLVVDEVSSALRKQGWISLTYVFLLDFKILRKAGYQRVRIQITS